MLKRLCCFSFALSLVLSFVLSFSVALSAQGSAPTKEPKEKDIDPLALRVLKAATDQIKEAKTLSFRTLVARETLGSNDQIITQFSTSKVTLQRPDKLHVDFRGRGEPVDLFFDGSGKTVLFSPAAKFYRTVPTPSSIDTMLDALEKKGVVLPASNLIQSDPYQSLTDDLTTGYAVGKVTLFDQDVYHLAFTEPGVEWQLWIVGSDKPVIKRLEVVDTSQQHQPRITVDFLDWDFNASASPDMFTFDKPADAKEIEMLAAGPEKAQ
jgi:hypothetical protein